MKEILELIITNLVDNKDEVSIEEIINNKNVDYKVKVSKEDMDIYGSEHDAKYFYVSISALNSFNNILI